MASSSDNPFRKLIGEIHRRATNRRSLHLLGAWGRWIALGLTVIASPARGQIPTVVYGQVQDVVSEKTLAGALIVDRNSTNAVLTNASGNFVLELRGPNPHALSVTLAGYSPATFEIPESAAFQFSIFPLLPAATAGYGVKPGDRIRIATDDASGDFRVLDVRPDFLELRADSVRTGLEVPTASLTRLAIYRGREMSLRRGLFGGSVFGALAGIVLGISCQQPHKGCVAFSSQTSILIGTGFGALIGLVLSRRSDERWQELRLPGASPG